MSVWTRVRSQVLEKDVNMEYFKNAIKEIDLELDFTKKEIQNAYGSERIDAMLRYKGKETTLGIIQNSKGGIELAGDTWRSGIAGDKAHTTVSNMMAQAYQVYKTKKQLELNGWSVVSKKVKDQVVLTCEQW